METNTDEIIEHIQSQAEAGGKVGADFLFGSSDEVEAFCRALITRGEGPKVDLKQQLNISNAQGKVEFCKDLSAIANSEDADPYLHGYGFILVGVDKSRKVVGGIEEFDPEKFDGTSATLTQIAKSYLAPVPRIHLVPFQDQELGPWGVIVIHPSTTLPHIFVKELNGNPGRHEWFVRVNDMTERAGPTDYTRVLQSAASRATRPLETEVQRLALRLDRMEDGRLEATDLVGALRQAVKSSPVQDAGKLEPTDTSDDWLASKVRRVLATPQSRLADDLLVEALKVRAAMIDERDENPQVFRSMEAAEVLKSILYMEENVRPFVEAVVTVVRYDLTGDIFNAVKEGIQIIAEEPVLTGARCQDAGALRTYPLALTVYGLAYASAARNDGRLLRMVLDLPFLFDWGESPLISGLRFAKEAGGLFNVAMQQRYYEPVAERCRQTVSGWLLSALPGVSPEKAWYQGEFGLALEPTGVPFPGTYLYRSEARGAIVRLLQRRSKFLLDLFGDSIGERLRLFDEKASAVAAPGAYGGGFFENAVAAWSGDSPK